MLFLCEVDIREIHYGDCTGADYEMFMLATSFEVKTVCHPPDKNAYRMFTAGSVIRPVKPYLARNYDIVSESDFLVAVPRESREPADHRGSGTWTTVGYARSSHRTVAVVFPDGRVDIQPPGW